MKVALKHSESEEIVILDKNNLKKMFSIYEAWTIDEDYESLLQEFRENRNADFEEWKEDNPEFTLSDVKNWLQEYIDDYEPNTNVPCATYYGRPKKWVQTNDDEFVEESIAENYYYEPNGACVADGDGYYLYDTYWDGSNWKEIIYLSDYFDTQWVDISDEIDTEEELEHVSGWRGHDETRWSVLLKGRDIDGQVIYFVKKYTAWQGESDTLLFAEDVDVLRFAIDDLQNEEFKPVLDNFLNSQPLKRGEKLYIDNGHICLAYRGEEYHFDYTEVVTFTPAEMDWCAGDYYSIEIPLDMAREVIRERRLDRIRDRMSENNYYKVLELPLHKIFVTIEDSLKANNCLAESKALAKLIKHEEGVDSPVRADIILKYRNDSYSRRAIYHAYLNNKNPHGGCRVAAP